VLVLNDGGMPKGNTGQLAAIYFEADRNPNDPALDAPRITVYGYNGGNSATSYREGIDSKFTDPAPTVAPLKVKSSLIDSSFVLDASVTENGTGPGSQRTLSMALDVSMINAFDPTSQGPEYAATDQWTGDPLPGGWEGVRYDETIGIWFHPFLAEANYGQDGFLVPDGTGWAMSANEFGFYDLDERPTFVVPEPASAMLMFGGAVLLGWRPRG
jgi:hypothetical protein